MVNQFGTRRLLEFESGIGYARVGSKTKNYASSKRAGARSSRARGTTRVQRVSRKVRGGKGKSAKRGARKSLDEGGEVVRQARRASRRTRSKAPSHAVRRGVKRRPSTFPGFKAPPAKRGKRSRAYPGFKRPAPPSLAGMDRKRPSPYADSAARGQLVRRSMRNPPPWAWHTRAWHADRGLPYYGKY